MIIDSHTHVDESNVFGWSDSPEKLIRLMDEAGIERAVIMTYVDVPGLDMEGLKYIASVVRRHPERLVGYARMHPYGTNAVSLLREAVMDLKLKGLKFHPETIAKPPYSNQSIALIKEAARLKVPVLFHTGDEAMSLPLKIGLAAEACPEATIILAHMGGYSHSNDALAVAERYDNVLLDTSATPYPGKIREAIERLGPERILFASDGPGCNPALEVAKIKQLKLSPRDEEKIFSENILKLLERANTK
jgi:predicted TIM-barrel fold metal-dependent hydrolase